MSEEKLSDVEVDGYMSRAGKLAAIMLRTPRQTDEGMPGCWFGGKPTLPPEIDWPIYHCPFPEIDIPLHFIFQINLKYVPRALEFPDMPDIGTIFIFVEPMMAPVYYGPQVPPMLSGEGTKIIYVADDVERCLPRTAPPLPDIDHEYPDAGLLREELSPGYLEMCHPQSGVSSADGLHRWPMVFQVGDTYPPYSEISPANTPEIGEKEHQLRLALERQISDYQSKKYDRGIKSKYRKNQLHWMFGAPQFNTFPSKENLIGRKGKELWPQLTDQHVQIFSIKSDDLIGFCYSEFRSISFWISRNDLRVGNFENVTVWEEL